MPIVTALAVAVLAPQALKPGGVAPSFGIDALSGKRLFLKDLLNEGPAFLLFLNPNDSLTRRAVPYFDRIVRSFPRAKGKWYGVITERPDRARSFAAEFNSPYAMLLDPELRLVKQYGIESSPAVVQIDTRGRVVKQWQGFSGYWLKDINRSWAGVQGKAPRRIDFSRTPSVTQYGLRYVGSDARGIGNDQ